MISIINCKIYCTAHIARRTHLVGDCGAIQSSFNAYFVLFQCITCYRTSVIQLLVITYQCNGSRRSTWERTTAGSCCEQVQQPQQPYQCQFPGQWIPLSVVAGVDWRPKGWRRKSYCSQSGSNHFDVAKCWRFHYSWNVIQAEMLLVLSSRQSKRRF